MCFRETDDGSSHAGLWDPQAPGLKTLDRMGPMQAGWEKSLQELEHSRMSWWPSASTWIPNPQCNQVQSIDARSPVSLVIAAIIIAEDTRQKLLAVQFSILTQTSCHFLVSRHNSLLCKSAANMCEKMDG